jgi:hypothetical protein
MPSSRDKPGDNFGLLIAMVAGQDVEVRASSFDRDLAEIGAGLLTLRVLASSEEEQPSWIKRRVQRLEFLDSTAVRWWISVDFVVPDEAPELTFGDEVLRLVPVATIAKKSLLAFSLRDESSRAICLPTSRETTDRLAAGLSFYAAELLDIKPQSLPEPLIADLRRVVNALPQDLRSQPSVLLTAAALIDARKRRSEREQELRGRQEAGAAPRRALVTKYRRRRRERHAALELAAANRAMQEVERSYQELLSKWSGMDASARQIPEKLMAIDTFRNQIHEFAANFIIHVGITAQPKTRHIVKLTYEGDLPATPPKSRFLRFLQQIGWRCWQVEVLIGGAGGNHHLEVTAPPGVEVVGITADRWPGERRRDGRAEDDARRGQGAGPGTRRHRWKTLASTWHRTRFWDPTADRVVPGRLPHVQISPPDGAFTRYLARIYVRVSRPGWLTASWLVTLVIAGMIIAGRLNLPAMYQEGNSGTTALLLLALLGVIATLLVGPAAHPLAARLLLVARLVISTDVLVVLMAVGNLVLHLSTDPIPRALWTGLSIVAGIAAIILSISRLLPVARRPYGE